MDLSDLVFPSFWERALFLMPSLTSPELQKQSLPVLLPFFSPLSLTLNPHLSYLGFPQLLFPLLPFTLDCTTLPPEDSERESWDSDLSDHEAAVGPGKS